MQPYFYIVLPQEVGDNAQYRFNAIATLNSGFDISHRDLEIRSAGQVAGTRPVRQGRYYRAAA